MIVIKSATHKIKLSPEQFKVELNKVMDTTTFYKAHLSSNLFSGKYNNAKDEFVFWKNYRVIRNSNRPTIHLKISKDERSSGSEIRVKFGFNKQFEIFSAITIILVFVLLTSVYFEKMDNSLIFPLFFGGIVMVLFVFLIGLLLFFFEYKSTKKSVEDFLNI